MGAIVPQVFENDEPRVRDLDIAERLDFRQSIDGRKLIRRNAAEMELHGVLATVAITSRRDGGRPGYEYWLNEEQALLFCMISRTPKAAAVRKEVIDVFIAYRRGRAPVTTSVIAGKLDTLGQGIERIEGNVTYLAERADRTDERVRTIEAKIIQKRGDFSIESVRWSGRGIAKYNNCECIYCNDVRVVTPLGEKLDSAREHHANYNRADVRQENCGLPCLDCHDRLHNPNRPDHIIPKDGLAIAETHTRKVRQKAALIKPWVRDGPPSISSNGSHGSRCLGCGGSPRPRFARQWWPMR